VEWRRILGWAALASVAGELVSAFFIEFPAGAIVFALLFLGGFLWLRRGGAGPVILIGLLSAIELLGLLFYERADADDWILQIVFLALGAVGVVAAIAVLRDRRTELGSPVDEGAPAG